MDSGKPVDVEDVEMREEIDDGFDEASLLASEVVPVGGFDDEDDGEIEGAVDAPEMADGEDIEDAVPDLSTFTIDSHTEPVYCVAINPVTHTMFATGGGDDVARVFQTLEVDGANQLKELFTLSGHTDSIVDIAFSTNGKYLATACYDATVKVWDTVNGALVQTLSGPAEAVEWIEWHKKGNVLLGGSGDATAWMWLAPTGACMQVFAGHEDAISCGGFSGDGKSVVTGSVDGSLKIWNPKTGECLYTFRAGMHGWHTESIVSVAVHPTKPLILSGSQDGTARLIQLQHNKVIGIFSHVAVKDKKDSAMVVGEYSSEMDVEEQLYSVEALGFSPELNYAASGAMDGSLKIWDLGTMKCRHVCSHPGGVIKLAWHARLPIVVTACADAIVRVWDARNGEILHELGGHRDVLLAMETVFEADDSYTILTGSDDKSAKLFQNIAK